MPDEYTVTESTEAHKIIIIMCAVGSTTAQLDNTSGAVKSRSTQSNIESSTELRSDLERLSTQSRSGRRKNDSKENKWFVIKNMFCWVLTNRNFYTKLINEGLKTKEWGWTFPPPLSFFHNLPFVSHPICLVFCLEACLTLPLANNTGSRVS
jgi:hypothetical protein